MKMSSKHPSLRYTAATTEWEVRKGTDWLWVAHAPESSVVWGANSPSGLEFVPRRKCHVQPGGDHRGLRIAGVSEQREVRDIDGTQSVRTGVTARSGAMGSRVQRFQARARPRCFGLSSNAPFQFR